MTVTALGKGEVRSSILRGSTSCPIFTMQNHAGTRAGLRHICGTVCSWSVRMKRSPQRSIDLATHVYVIDRGDGFTKIGISRNTKKRRNSLQAATPDRLKIVFRLKPETMSAGEVERRALALLKPWHVSGEWFRCAPRLAKIAVEAAYSEDAAFGSKGSRASEPTGPLARKG